MSRIGVVGAGSWGTALANVAAAAHNDVILWARDSAQAKAMQAARENARYLPGISIHDAIDVTDDLAAATSAETILMAVPAQTSREVAETMASHIAPGTPLVICAKGIERSTGKLMSEVIAEILPEARPAILSGPTFAAEVAKGLPAAVTLACADTGLAETLMHELGTPAFRPYASDDIVGAQIGGALKNVIAIACGIIEGRGLGLNANAALIARGLAEIGRLGAALGAQERTLVGLAGVGDLTLTCTSHQSRNYALGVALGSGEIAAVDIGARGIVTEGVHTGPGVLARAATFGLEMPIAAAVSDVLHQGMEIGQSIDELLARPFRREY